MQALGTGLDGITDQPALKPSVTVTSLHGVHGAPVSEAALAGMLALSRDMPGFVRAAGRARTGSAGRPSSCTNKTVGILGIGVIAEALAPKCKAMGMTVVGITSAPRRSRASTACTRSANCCSVLPELDYLVLLTPYSPATHHMIDAKVFAAMKPIELPDQPRARRRGRRGRAGRGAARRRRSRARPSTCSSQEPLPADHPLWTFKNVIITTHQGGFCDTYVDLAMPILEHNMRCFLKGDLKGMINVARPAA